MFCFFYKDSTESDATNLTNGRVSETLASAEKLVVWVARLMTGDRATGSQGNIFSFSSSNQIFYQF